MIEPEAARSKQPRDKYSRLICLGCCKRRIRCELPGETQIPDAGQLHRVRTPCYRCRRLGIPCIVRQTVLGRPTASGQSTATADLVRAKTSKNRSCIFIELPLRTAVHDCSQNTPDQAQLVGAASPGIISCSVNSLPPGQKEIAYYHNSTLLIHVPQSTETFMIIRAIDTLRYEKVEQEWFRHLPARVGNTRALDLAIKAIVAACTYSRGVPNITSQDCYRALALALNAVQADIKQACKVPSDDILAATALLVPFEGAMNKNGTPTRLHVEGLAAILGARPPTYPVTNLAREILDFHACESAILSCIQDKPSLFESMSREYFANVGMASGDRDQAQLKALSIELFIRIPRLVKLVRQLRFQQVPQDQPFWEAAGLLTSLLSLQDIQAEKRLLRKVPLHTIGESDAARSNLQMLHFASVKDFEVLSYYWQSRLCLLRLQWQLYQLSMCRHASVDRPHQPGIALSTSFRSKDNEVLQLVKSILMCLEYFRTLPLRKHVHLVALAMVTVWGAMRNIPLAIGHDQNEQGEESVSVWLLQAMNIALDVKPNFTAQDMDTAADIFVGGWSEGRFAKLYGL